MTTVAYRDGIVAVDSRAMIGGWKCPYSVDKVWRLDDGSVVAGSGDLGRVNAMRAWLDGPQTQPKPDLTDTSVYHFRKHGLITVYEHGGEFLVTTKFAAWGSGSPPALGALHMGATAQQAVEIAALVDDQTDGNVITMAVG